MVVANGFIHAESMKILMEVEHSRTKHGSPGLEKSVLVVLPWTSSAILDNLPENLSISGHCLFR